jgi:hypothetical protein
MRNLWTAFIACLARLRIAFWWKAEQTAGRLWNRIAGRRADCWFDAAPAFTYRQRQAAERAYLQRFDVSSIYDRPGRL